MKEMILTLTVVSLSILISGCASIVDGTSKTVRVNSQPSGAKFTIYNQEGKAVNSKTTPASVELKRGRGMFIGENYRVAFEASGYHPGDTQIESKVNGWFYGNIALGGLVGMVIDGATGAMWNLSPAEINFDLVPASPVTNSGNVGNRQAQAESSTNAEAPASVTEQPPAAPENSQ